MVDPDTGALTMMRHFRPLASGMCRAELAHASARKACTQCLHGAHTA